MPPSAEHQFPSAASPDPFAPDKLTPAHWQIIQRALTSIYFRWSEDVATMNSAAALGDNPFVSASTLTETANQRARERDELLGVLSLIEAGAR